MWTLSLASIAIEDITPRSPLVSMDDFVQEDAVAQDEAQVAYFRSLLVSS